MNKKFRIAAAVLVGLGLLASLAFYLQSLHIPILEPKGLIAHEQRNLLIIAVILSLFVIVPVYIMTIFIAWKYRARNKKARHTPDWETHVGVEAFMWGIPCAIILILSVITWRTSHSLDPFRAIESNKKPLTIQVVALQYKWLFIYPEQKIATVNYFQMPEDQPVTFEITSDAPMNSFWIPQLGGQIYAMSGMTTKLHLQADDVGRYRGASANISGAGFASMRFTAEAVTSNDFEQWVASVKKSPKVLDQAAYDTLAKPSEEHHKILYTLAKADLHRTIVMKYMIPQTSSHNGEAHGHEGDGH